MNPLLQGHWYDALAGVLEHRMAGGDRRPELAYACRLAGSAKRILDLDAEDFHQLAAEFPDEPWAGELRSASFPADPRSADRGALGSLVPLYRLMLEVVEVRAARQEPLQMVVTAHLIGEYLPLLAWEPVLGHAGDPLRLGELVGHRWGTGDADCPHSSALGSAARRALRACEGDDTAYNAYLDRFHSRLGDALSVCAMNEATVPRGQRPLVGAGCPSPCDWVVRLPSAERRQLDARVRLALLYRATPMVALRHHAPVGHFFGVPSAEEIATAWRRTWEKLTAPWPRGDNPLAGVTTPAEPGEALPGLATLVSAVAGRPLAPARMIRGVGESIDRVLGGLGPPTE